MSKSDKRPSIRSHLMPHIEAVGKRIGETDITVIVNHIIWEHRQGISGANSASKEDPPQQSAPPVASELMDSFAAFLVPNN